MSMKDIKSIIFNSDTSSSGVRILITKLDLTNWDVEHGTQFLDLASRHTTLIVEDGAVYMIRESVDFGIDNLLTT